MWLHTFKFSPIVFILNQLKDLMILIFLQKQILKNLMKILNL